MKNRSQLDLFVVTPESRGPLAGLAVRLPDVCRCGSDVAKIGSPVGPHLAELYCAHCERHRGWLPRVAHEFLAEVVNKFGRPTAPITIRRSERHNTQHVAGARRAERPNKQRRR
jgi:hypothetical protein